MADVTYRLPDWLGSHAVEYITEKHPAGGTVNVALMRLVGGTYDGLVVAVKTDDLVEVKPPSIDEPVSWPLAVRYQKHKLFLRADHEDQRLTVLEIEDDDEAEAAGIAIAHNDLRDLARAAWQRANAIEAS